MTYEQYLEESLSKGLLKKVDWGQVFDFGFSISFGIGAARLFRREDYIL